MAFSVWLLLGGSVAYWGLQLFARPLPMPGSVLSAGDSRATQVDLSRLLGVTAPDAAPEPEAAPSTRLRLLGVVAPKSAKAAEAGEGVAVIEVDGVARTVRVGAVVDGELRLLRVDARTASLGRMGQAPAQVLQMSAPPAAATGSLPPAAPSPVCWAATRRVPWHSRRRPWRRPRSTACRWRLRGRSSATKGSLTSAERGGQALSAQRRDVGAVLGPHRRRASATSCRSVSRAAAARIMGQASAAPVPSALSMPSSNSAEAWKRANASSRPRCTWLRQNTA